MSEWIDVKERLPEPGQMVIALFERMFLRHGVKREDNHDGSGTHPYWCVTVRELVPRSDPQCRWADEGVTHWMPFQPPARWPSQD